VLSKQAKTPLLEKLAALEHEQWKHLMTYIYSISIHGKTTVEQTNQTWNRWKVLANTPYERLMETEKASDRIFAREVLELLKREGVIS